MLNYWLMKAVFFFCNLIHFQSSSTSGQSYLAWLPGFGGALQYRWGETFCGLKPLTHQKWSKKFSWFCSWKNCQRGKFGGKFLIANWEKMLLITISCDWQQCPVGVIFNLQSSTFNLRQMITNWVQDVWSLLFFHIRRRLTVLKSISKTSCEPRPFRGVFTNEET